MDLTGQVALITGGSRGLGRAFAQALLAVGARVAITGRTAPELHETAAQLSSTANQVLAIPADTTDPQGAPQVVTTVEQRLGPITVLINNAGQFRAFGPIGVIDPIAWWNEVEVNLRGPFLYANAVLPGMRTRHKGRIINVASMAGMQAIPIMSAYVVSKTALIRFSEALALDTVEDGIRVFAIHPGVMLRGCSSGTKPCTLKDSIRLSNAPCTWCCDSPPATPIRSLAATSVWRMTSTH